MNVSDTALEVKLYAEAVKVNERDHHAWLGLSRCLLKMGRIEDAFRPMLCALFYADEHANPDTYESGIQYIAENDHISSVGDISSALFGDTILASKFVAKLAIYAARRRRWGRDFPTRLMEVAWKLDQANLPVRNILVGWLSAKNRHAKIIGILNDVPPDTLSDDEGRILSVARKCIDAETAATTFDQTVNNEMVDRAARAQALLQSIVIRRASNKTADITNYRASRYLDYPRYLHLETLAMCNAACTFCPYPGLERKGTRMPDELINKVLRDLEDIPDDLPFTLAPFKVSDPFLEKRIFDVIHHAEQRLPSASIALITNGAAMTERHLDRLMDCSNILNVTISLNDHRPEHYEALMKIPYQRTIQRMAALHDRVKHGDFKFEVFVSRIIDGSEADIDFRDWVKSEFPYFQLALSPRNDWIGQMDIATSVDVVPDVGCNRWFMMSITATGKVALCCMDGEEQYVVGDVSKQHVLDVYNSPSYKIMRETLETRKEAATPCNRCTYL